MESSWEEDARLAEQFLEKNDEAAFEAIIAKYRTRLLLIPNKYGLNDMGEDLVQECFIRLYQHMPNVRDPISISSWLWRVMQNLCWHMRRERLRERQQNHPISDATMKVSALLDLQYQRSDLLMSLETCLMELPQKKRHLVFLKFVKGYSCKEIGKLLKRRTGSISSCLARIYKKLRICLGLKGAKR